MTPDEMKALIEEARRWTDQRVNHTTSGMGWSYLVRRLTDALEAALSAHLAEETEWAGAHPAGGIPQVGPYDERYQAERGIEAYNYSRPPEQHVVLIFRHKAGLWSPVPTDGEATDALS